MHLNESNLNMQHITIQFDVTVGLYFNIIFYQRRVDIIDQV